MKYPRNHRRLRRAKIRDRRYSQSQLAAGDYALPAGERIECATYQSGELRIKSTAKNQPRATSH